MQDKRIRQAMSYAIDKELLIEQTLQGQGVASYYLYYSWFSYEIDTSGREM